MSVPTTDCGERLPAVRTGRLPGVGLYVMAEGVPTAVRTAAEHADEEPGVHDGRLGRRRRRSGCGVKGTCNVKRR